MRKTGEFLKRLGGGVMATILRFPLTVLCLVLLVIELILSGLTTGPTLLILDKFEEVLLFGAILGVIVEVACECFERLWKIRWIVYTGAVLSLAGYFLLLLPLSKIGNELSYGLLSIEAALFLILLWLSTFKGKIRDRAIALIHIESACVALLVGFVFMLGVYAAISAFSALVFTINESTYATYMAMFFFLSVPFIYLARLPRFNIEEKEKIEETLRGSKLAKKLVVFISIPSILVYTAVAVAYFVKMLVTRNWTSGEVDPLVLWYSATGLVLYVLAGSFESRLSKFYIKFFPKILIVFVLVQLVSVCMRLSADSVTVSRYYAALLGIYSLVCAVVLIIKKTKRTGILALIAAGILVISVLPQTNAFTLSRISQTLRLEQLLTEQRILADGKITPKKIENKDIRLKIYNMLEYLRQNDYLGKLEWIPTGFDPNTDMKKTFGFDVKDSFDTVAVLDDKAMIDVSQFDVFTEVWMSDFYGAKEFKIGDKTYHINVEKITPFDCKVSVYDNTNREIIAAQLYEYAKTLTAEANNPYPVDEMTIDKKKDGYTLRVVLKHVIETEDDVRYWIYILFDAPDT